MSDSEREVYELILRSLDRIEKIAQDDSNRKDELRVLRLRYSQRIDSELSKIRVALEVLASKPSAG